MLNGSSFCGKVTLRDRRGSRLGNILQAQTWQVFFFFFVVIEMFKYSDPHIFTADSPFHTTVDVTESA